MWTEFKLQIKNKQKISSKGRTSVEVASALLDRGKGGSWVSPNLANIGRRREFHGWGDGYLQDVLELDTWSFLGVMRVWVGDISHRL